MSPLRESSTLSLDPEAPIPPQDEPGPGRPAASLPPEQIIGRRFIRILEDHLQTLRAHRHHGNRAVFYDHLVVAYLLAFFNPTVATLRKIEDLFEHPQVRKRFGSRRLPKSTLSDAQRVFDPHLLRPIMESLKRQAPIQPHDPRLDAITRKLLAVDGSFFTVAPRIAWALFNGSGKGNVRTHVQFDVLAGLPDSFTFTDGQSSETQQLRATLRSDRFYVMDRGFQDYQLLADILHLQSDFVVRLRKSAQGETCAELPLTAADQAAGVRRDARIRLGGRSDRTPQLPDLRRIEVVYTSRQGGQETMILLTNRFDLPAYLIALIYQHRWQVELFFRWIKCTANFKHFFCESLSGMTLQMYVVMIGLLLIAIETGAKPSVYDYSLLAAVASGLLPLDDETLRIAARRRAERARAAAREKAYRARKKNAP